MRSLPPPRRSRARWIRRLVNKLYRVLTLDSIFNRRSTIVIKKRRNPFHRSSKRYKHKMPKKHRFKLFRRPSSFKTIKVLSDLSQDISDSVGVSETGVHNIHFKSQRVIINGRGSRAAQLRLSRSRRVFKSLVKRLLRSFVHSTQKGRFTLPNSSSVVGI